MRGNCLQPAWLSNQARQFAARRKLIRYAVNPGSGPDRRVTIDALAKRVERGAAVIPVPRLKPILKPLIEPVVVRLDKHETLLFEMKSVLDVQFQRIAAMQAQLDHLLATLRKRS